MAAKREQVLAALMTRLQTLIGTSVQTYSRAYIDPNQLEPEKQPALLLLADSYENTKERGRPNIWTVNALVIIYARASEMADPSDASPETPLNALIDAVEDALARQPTESITDMTNPTDTNLGGLCSKVTINGTIDIIPGVAGGQAAAFIPVALFGVW